MSEPVRVAARQSVHVRAFFTAEHTGRFMELSPEEYGAYWRASIRVAAGVLVVFFGLRLTSPLRTHPEVGASALGVVMLVMLALVGTFLAVLGVARVVRTAVDAET